VRPAPSVTYTKVEVDKFGEFRHHSRKCRGSRSSHRSLDEAVHVYGCVSPCELFRWKTGGRGVGSRCSHNLFWSICSISLLACSTLLDQPVGVARDHRVGRGERHHLLP